ncbi:MAG: SPOR domain-containing protein [Acidobacteria bacterium]|nr:SPOR domain-containing protein [Acidobacteriota bacterium]MCZ6769960.1 SPOR domain-containing protein [Acidobacteriota bacterium]MCZ6879086.1 SPOR domain-containing protein [Acidobacteriota bacterium]
MKAKLSPRESMALYGVVLGFIFLFYLLGLFLGRDHFVEARTTDGSFSLSDTPVQDLQPPLDFYQRLMVPSEPEQESAPSADGFPVAAEVSEEDSAGPLEDSSTNPAEPFTVQVGAFTAEVDARQILIRLEAKGYAGALRHSSSQDPYYRVWVGEFKTVEEVAQMNDLLRQDGFLTYIRKVPASSPTY